MGSASRSPGRTGSWLDLPDGAALVVATAALVVLTWVLVAGVNPLFVLAAAALPLGVALGYRYSFPLLVAALVLRPIVDGAGVFTLTAGIGVSLIVLALLMAVHDARALVLMAGVGVPLLVAAAVGAAAWGSVAWEEYLRILSVVGVAAITLTTPTAVTRVSAARVVQVAGLVPAVAAIIQLVTASGTRIGDVLRTSGTLSQANPAAHFFGLCALASLVVIIEKGATKKDVAALVVFGFAVLTTGSIGGTASFVVALIGYLIFAKGLFSRAVAAALGALGVAVGVMLLTPLGQGRLAEFVAQSGPERPENSWLWRLEAWDKILDAWRTSPILGKGLGATTEGAILSKIAHNEYVYVLAELGVIGAALIVTAGVAYVAWLVRFRRRGASSLNLALAGAVLLSILVDSAIDNPLHFSPSTYVAALLLATAWRCSSHERAQAEAIVTKPRELADA